MTGREVDLNTSCNSSNDSRWSWALLSVFILIGLVLRLYQLGKFGFWTDELLHVIGAKSMLEAGRSVVPGKGEYTRAYPITYLTAMLFRYVGESEGIARFPYVVINMLFVSIGFLLVKNMFDVKIALIFSFVMAFSPFEIVMSRECRMYAIFQLLYFSGSMMFFAGMEADTFPKKRKTRIFQKLEDTYDINIFYLSFSLVLLLSSAYFHELSYNFSIVALTYSSLMIAIVFFKEGYLKAIFSKYSLIIIVICSLFFSVYLYSPGFIKNKISLALYFPEWAHEGNAYLYYWTFFVRNYPFFIYCYLLSMFFTIRKYGKVGVFLLTSFLPVLMMHSFVFTGRVSDRYIFYIFPFFILGSSYIISMILNYCVERSKEFYSRKSYALILIFSLCLVPAFYLIGKPWLGEIRGIHNKYNYSDWKTASNDLKRIPDNSVVISTRINNVYYYLGRMPNYNVRKSMFEIKEKDATLGGKSLSLNLIMERDTLEQITYKSKDAYFLADRWSYNLPGYMDDSMREFIKENYVPVPHGGDRAIIIMRYNEG